MANAMDVVVGSGIDDVVSGVTMIEEVVSGVTTTEDNDDTEEEVEEEKEVGDSIV